MFGRKKKHFIHCVDYKEHENGLWFVKGPYASAQEALKACGDYIRVDLENRRAILIEK